MDKIEKRERKKKPLQNMIGAQRWAAAADFQGGCIRRLALFN